MASKPKPKRKPKAKQDEGTTPDALAIELGRIAKLLALHMLKDVEDENKKVARLNAVGFSRAEIAAMLDKTEDNVRVQLAQKKSKK